MARIIGITILINRINFGVSISKYNPLIKFVIGAWEQWFIVFDIGIWPISILLQYDVSEDENEQK